MSQDVILLSSDDEFEASPSKKFKPGRVKEVLNKLSHLKGITTTKCGERNTVITKNVKVENNITIVIESDEKCKENNITLTLQPKSKENHVKTEQIKVSGDCLTLESDSDIEEVENPAKEPSLGKPLDVILERPSTSTATEAHKLLDEFLETCAKSIKGTKYESKLLDIFPKIKQDFNKCDSIHEEPVLKKMLREHTARAAISAPEAVVSFQRISSYFKDIVNGQSVEVEAEDLRKLQKLESTCKKIMRRLKKLEEAEVNFDDEEDSVFIMMDRYSRRLTKVYAMYCKLLKKSPYAGRFLHEKVQFVSSSHHEINRAITKWYKTNKFPSYYDIEKVVKKCVGKNNLDLTESEIKDESKRCFTAMGNLLQMRRKRELYEVHSDFIALNEDPAKSDEELNMKLQASKREGEERMKQVVEKYVKMQENNVSVDVSDDSDDSNFKDSSESEGD